MSLNYFKSIITVARWIFFNISKEETEPFTHPSILYFDPRNSNHLIHPYGSLGKQGERRNYFPLSFLWYMFSYAYVFIIYLSLQKKKSNPIKQVHSSEITSNPHYNVHIHCAYSSFWIFFQIDTFQWLSYLLFLKAV